MKISEIIDKTVNLGNGEIIAAVKIDNRLTCDAKIQFNSEWNAAETKKIVTECWCQETTLFEDGTEIEMPAWHKLDVSLFVQAKIDEEYIENIIN